ncbi:hypothetical protein HOP50_14g72360 [Chloropicon primus]|nr:hypothetical protein HOP50_14g72360 [Chloropicon primus]
MPRVVMARTSGGRATLAFTLAYLSTLFLLLKPARALQDDHLGTILDNSSQDVVLVSSYAFSQEECRSRRGVWTGGAGVNATTTTTSEESAGYLGNLTATNVEVSFGILHCPESVGLTVRGSEGSRDVSGLDGDGSVALVSSTRDASELLSHVRQRRGLSLEVWVTFDGESLKDWSKEDAIFGIGTASWDGGTNTNTSCSLGWSPFSLQVRQRGPSLVAEARGRAHRGHKVCHKTSDGVEFYVREESEQGGEVQANVFAASPHHIALTVEDLAPSSSVAGPPGEDNATRGAGALRLYFDGELLSETLPELHGRVGLEDSFLSAWNETHRLVLGSPSVFGTRWRGTIHAVSTFVGVLPGSGVRSRHRERAGLAPSSPVIESGVSRVMEDEVASVTIQGFDFDIAHRPNAGNSTMYFYITRSVDAGQLVDPRTGQVINVTEGEPHALGEGLAEIWEGGGKKLGKRFFNVSFIPEKDDFSPPQPGGTDLQPYTFFRYKACDEEGHCSTEGTVLVEVLSKNDPPAPQESVEPVYLGKLSMVNFPGLDPDGTGDIEAIDIVKLPRHGTLYECARDEEGGLLLGDAVAVQAHRLTGQVACYAFEDEPEALAGLREGKDTVATDSISFGVVDSHNVTSTNTSELHIHVLNPLIGINKTVACDEEGEAWINLTLSDARAESEEDLGMRILSLPEYGDLYYRSRQSSEGSSKSDLVAVLKGQQPREWLGACDGQRDARSACVSFVYVPSDNFFNDPDLLGGSQPEKFADLGIRERPPRESFAYEVTTSCCRSAAYAVELKVTNTEDESQILLSRVNMTATFLQPVPVPRLAIRDPDKHMDLFLVDLYVTAGVLDVGSHVEALSYLTFAMGDGHDDGKMVFRGSLQKVNEVLGNLTYTALTRGGVEKFSIKVTDMDLKPGLSRDGDGNLNYYASHSRSMNITIDQRPRAEAGSGGEKKVCVKFLGACASEKILYGILFATMMLIFLSPLLFWAYKAAAVLLRCLAALLARATTTTGSPQGKEDPLSTKEEFRDLSHLHPLPKQAATI